jgi:hypothetical protein
MAPDGAPSIGPAAIALDANTVAAPFARQLCACNIATAAALAAASTSPPSATILAAIDVRLSSEPKPVAAWMGPAAFGNAERARQMPASAPTPTQRFGLRLLMITASAPTAFTTSVDAAEAARDPAIASAMACSSENVDGERDASVIVAANAANCVPSASSAATAASSSASFGTALAERTAGADDNVVGRPGGAARAESRAAHAAPIAIHRQRER